MKSLILFFLLVLFWIPALPAQIYYQNIVPDETLNMFNSRDIRIDSSSTARLSPGAPGDLTIWNDFGTQILTKASSDCEVAMTAGLPSQLDSGAPIDGNLFWAQPDNSALISDAAPGHWTGGGDHFLGVRIRKAGQWYYGWIRLDVDAGGKSVTIKDYACNMLSEVDIKAGQSLLSVDSKDANPEAITAAIYPNPFTVSANVLISGIHGTFEMRVYDLFGREVARRTGFTNHGNVLERGDLLPGVYFLEVCSASRRFSAGRFVITR
jgi:hypothetical protein